MAVKPLMCEVPKGFVQQGVKPPNDAQKPEGILRISPIDAPFWWVRL
jgi:hypothetical protein